MTFLSNVKLVGTVTAIDLEKRDLTVKTKTPKGKEVAVIVHMWKAPSDGDNEAWQGRAEWKDVITTDMKVMFYGHLGNNARIIATSFSPIELENDEIAEYSEVSVAGKVASIDMDNRNLIINTATRRGKLVVATIHMWKTAQDSDDEAFANRYEWRNEVTAGSDFVVKGHLGNNARVIATGYTPITSPDYDEEENTYGA